MKKDSAIPLGLLHLPEELLLQVLVVGGADFTDLVQLSRTSRLFVRPQTGKDQCLVEQIARTGLRQREPDMELKGNEASWMRLLKFSEALKASCKRIRGMCVAAGLAHSLVWTAQSGLVMFGDNQLMGPVNAVPLGCKVVVQQVSAGGAHSILLTTGGQILTFGFGQFGQLGLGSRAQTMVPTEVPRVAGRQAMQVAAGFMHSLVLWDSGEVWSCGNGRFGQLGNSNTEPDVLWLEPVPSLKGGVVQIAAGGGHNGFLMGCGELLTCGYSCHGQTGHGDTINRSKPEVVIALAFDRALQVAAGGGHTVVVMSDNSVFTFGEGAFGQLGHGSRIDHMVPRTVLSLVAMKVKQVAAGGGHTVVVMEDGSVVTFGRGRPGQLGHGQSSDSVSPKRVASLSCDRVAQVAAGVAHTVMIDSRGTILSCGSGFHGQLGHRDIGDQLTPKTIQFLMGALHHS